MVPTNKVKATNIIEKCGLRSVPNPVQQQQKTGPNQRVPMFSDSGASKTIKRVFWSNTQPPYIPLLLLPSPSRYITNTEEVRRRQTKQVILVR